MDLVIYFAVLQGTIYGNVIVHYILYKKARASCSHNSLNFYEATHSN